MTLFLAGLCSATGFFSGNSFCSGTGLRSGDSFLSGTHFCSDTIFFSGTGLRCGAGTGFCAGIIFLGVSNSSSDTKRKYPDSVSEA